MIELINIHNETRHPDSRHQRYEIETHAGQKQSNLSHGIRSVGPVSIYQKPQVFNASHSALPTLLQPYSRNSILACSLHNL